MNAQPPQSFANSKTSSLPSPSHTSGTTRTQRRRQLWRRHLLTYLVFLGLLLSILAISNPAHAQSSGDEGSSSSPPPPQPGSNPNGQGAAAAPSGNSSPNTKDSSHGHDSVTSSSTITATVSAPKPTTITTVTVINGTTTTMTLTITPSPAAGANPGPPPPTSLPKAPQSILVIQSTSYGKVLPAAGPVDDQIESHFWDQFVPRDPGVKASDGSLSPVWSGSRETRTMILTALMVILVVGLLSQ
ncbi:hypothetical protein BGZ83_007848 [Gryganskiella cystojenkinii]|nr:hypothetical protein BGZ83_007848 [Gryganskiella cystojenkinii]